MKRIHTRLLLLAALVIDFASTPATAQTPLLEIDYQTNPLFHVLSDGSLYLPLGANDGYVLTSDGDGYATWQAASTGGLMVVTSDATLSGDGTPGSPLGVAAPLVLTGTNNGVVGGIHTNNNYGSLGNNLSGALGFHANGNFGNLGSSNYGVYGSNNNTNFGYFGSSDHGAYGAHTLGSYGYLGNTDHGAYGEHNNGHFGSLGNGSSGARGEHTNGNVGTLGGQVSGARGGHSNGNFGRLGHEDYGVYGESDGGAFGYLGFNSSGAFGSNGSGVWGALGHGLLAGSFDGDVIISGGLVKGGGAFKIDHPLDPAEKYLSHSFVESPDMMNVYNGNVTTDAAGFATVILPAYFQVLNRDFRYQLTVIGQFAQAIVAEKMRDNRFVIRTDQPNVEVSWQVTGIRQDAWAEANRVVVEEDKPAEERGYYIHPKLYGQPEERSIAWARDPEGMRAMQERPQRREAQRQQIEQERRHIEQERQRMQAEPEQRPDNQP